ncbi:MAG TPA: trypsin-like peptidase domain-containing protein [Gemmataceae bacterium]|nr:trypsin-like peptidase domain-containing protein [Gemmataceae bacterium]
MRTVCWCLVVAILTAAATYAFTQKYPSAPPVPVEKVVPPAAPAPAENAAPPAAPPAPIAQVVPPAAPAPAPAAPEPADVSPEELVNIRTYRQVNRSVVNITTRGAALDDFLLLITPREGSGSGSVLDQQGHILTNFHVVEDARQIVVTLFDGSTHEARLVGADPNNDLAVLQIDAPADKLFPITWGDSGRLLVGMRVFAIGNPFGLERTLTTGIVSSLNRSLRSDNGRLIRGVIQTDAAINPGNSGGPLLNRRGEVVGITTAIVSRAGQSSGIGLAIPSSTARRVVADLIRYGRVIRPDCGIFSVYELERGLLIARLVPGGPAQRAGLRGPEEVLVRRGGVVYRRLDRSKADLIVAVDGKPARSFDDLLSYVESKKPGDLITLTVVREGERLDIPVTLELSRN